MNLQNIKAEIVRQGLTQKELAAKLGISSTGLNYKLNGKRKLTAKDLVKICNVLDIKIDILL